MCKYEGYDAFIATYYTKNFSNLKFVSGLRVEIVPKITGKWPLDSCLWLIKNAKRINVLNIYHMCTRTVFQAAFFRLFNRKGKIYMRCDGCPTKTSGRAAKYFLGRVIKRILGGWLIRNADHVSTEVEDNVELLKREWGCNNVFYYPTPLHPMEYTDFRPFSQRSNTILTVGRLGTKQKATEILLEAFVKIADQIPDWTLKLAGPFVENIHIADDFYKAHPELSERVIFTGNISDRNELAALYEDSKIFAFPTRYESFGIVITEAMIHGCFAVATRIQTNTSLTENFRYALGSPVDDVDGLAKNLLWACTHEDEAEKLAHEGRQATMKRLDLKMRSDILAEILRS